ncbi:pilus assembly protein TadG-related protein [Candidatus Aeolococcus gillhamiae]
MNRRHPRVRNPRRESSKGQVMPIFALVVVVLFAATGLAVDAGMAFLSYNGAERAAAAAALAGVPYMPSGLNAGITGTTPEANCANTAAAAACAATARDGLKNGSTVNGHTVSVKVSRYPATCDGTVTNPCADNKLTVQVTAWVQPTFLRVLGFGDHAVTASDTAFFLPPISLGQPGAQLGSSVGNLGVSGNYYFLRSEGYGNPRSEGDAYDPYNQDTTFSCGSGVTTDPAPNPYGPSTDTHALAANMTPSPTDVSDGTLTGAGVNKLPERGGYNFTLQVPTTGSYPLVYNPAFAPDGGFNPSGGAYNLHEQDGSFSGNAFTDQYSAMEYTVFRVVDRFDHTQDVPLSQIWVDPLNVTITSGAVSSIVDVANGQTLSATSNATAFAYVRDYVYHSWVSVGAPSAASASWTSGGTTYNVFHVVKTLSTPLTASTTTSYRLRVDMLDYNGLRPADDSGASKCSRAHKGYAVQLAYSGGTQCTDCQVSALDELAVYTPIITSGSGGFSVPLFSLPADYAGQTVNFYIFDPGDVSGQNAISILNPDDKSCGGAGQGGCLFSTTSGVPIYDLGMSRNVSPLPAVVNTADSCASSTLQPNTNQALINTYPITNSCGRPATFFNGHWLLFQLQIPSNYAGGYSTTPSTSGNGYWQLHYSLTSGTASDTFTIAVNYANSPVHLL